MELGAKTKRSIGASDLTKIVFDLPTSVDEDFAQSLRAYLVARTTESWMFLYGLLKGFIKEHGHGRVPQGYKTDDGYRLGIWVNTQRLKKNEMEPDHRQRLDALPGWSWNPWLDRWEEGFSYLKEFSDRKGHCRVHKDYKTDDGYPLGTWVAKQRLKKDKMKLDRRQRLEALPGWSWNARVDKWEEGFSYLKEFSDRKGHCRVPRDYKTDDGYPLGTWVQTQRPRRETMEPDRRQRLEALPGWSWDAHSDAWEERFSYLKEFSDRKSHCRVPYAYKTKDGYPLGMWVSNRRSAKDEMELDRRQRLEALPGWVWKVEKSLPQAAAAQEKRE
jgi:hypothetical protein